MRGSRARPEPPWNVWKGAVLVSSPGLKVRRRRFFNQFECLQHDHVAFVDEDLDIARQPPRPDYPDRLTQLPGCSAPRPPLEVRQLVGHLLDRLGAGQLRQARVLEVLEQIADSESRRLPTAIAGGSSQAGLTRDAQAVLHRLGH
ncbi:MAG TPA: hypothetical protein VNX28_06270 [Gemmataceae bacterium]|nr:hypothetical protein [Gemmataceae bacterium]